ncbi:hypothetical protein UFOVP232_17 [uncultured Caudovirales phage]|uniref:Uncharacterized protein n=1 Tax=uncultured Caudovirales phage TaxID=2100421 RepID=A0A6J7WQE0_9CAUD|nr:hypothetical protein UFOVP232_17 [uncultured Caudovirales phage]
MSIKKHTIATYVRHLHNLGCNFKIIEADGTEHGSLEVAKVYKPRVRVLGTIDYKSVIDAIAVGDVAEIACGALPAISVRSSVTSYATSKYGRGKFTTTIDPDTNVVEIMRLEE